MAAAKITLVGTPSSRAIRDIWMLTELKLPYESDPTAITDPRLKQPPYTDTVADLNTASVMYRALWMPLDDFPRTRDWLTRCWAREGGLAARRARGEKV